MIKYTHARTHARCCASAWPAAQHQLCVCVCINIERQRDYFYFKVTLTLTLAYCEALTHTAQHSK
jgi:hypothetical protein